MEKIKEMNKEIFRGNLLMTVGEVTGGMHVDEKILDLILYQFMSRINDSMV